MKTFCHLNSAVVLLLLCTYQSHAQGIPAKVKQAFINKFANATEVKWDMEKGEIYEADFVSNGHEMSALFDAEGNWKETEITISENELPQSVKLALLHDFKDAEIKEIARIVRVDQTFYEVEIVSNGDKEDEDEDREEEDENDEEEEEHSIDLIFDKNGKLIKKETDNE